MLEATAWQTREVVDAMNSDAGVALTSLKVDGGMTANNLLMQSLADVLDVPVVRPIVAETSSLGAAYAAGLAVGFWPDVEDLRAQWHKAAEWPARHGAGRAREGLPQVAQGGGEDRRLGGRGRRRLSAPAQPSPPNVSAAVRSSRCAEVAPGSWCPTLRGPR